MLTTAALFQLAMQCAPAVHPDTIHDITRTESGLNPYAIAEIVPVKGGRSRVISHLPSSKDEALKIVEAEKAPLFSRADADNQHQLPAVRRKRRIHV